MDLHGMTGSHTDSVLLSRPQEHARLVRRCVEIGLAAFTLKGVGIFLVREKNADSRMVLDCRRDNTKFSTLRSVAVLTAEGICNIEIEENWDGERDRHNGGSWWQRRGAVVRGQEFRPGDGNCRRVRLLSPV